jgi:hypothetical protein
MAESGRRETSKGKTIGSTVKDKTGKTTGSTAKPTGSGNSNTINAGFTGINANSAFSPRGFATSTLSPRGFTNSTVSTFSPRGYNPVTAFSPRGPLVLQPQSTGSVTNAANSVNKSTGSVTNTANSVDSKNASVAIVNRKPGPSVEYADGSVEYPDLAAGSILRLKISRKFFFQKNLAKFSFMR